MTDPKNETVWITIPDEATPATADKPALEGPLKPQKRESSERVQNKVFWGAGFVALIAFVALLFAPQEFAGLMKAQLFDGTFQVVPDYEQQQGGALFGEGEGEEDQEEAVDGAPSEPLEEKVTEALNLLEGTDRASDVSSDFLWTLVESRIGKFFEVSSGVIHRRIEYDSLKDRLTF